MEVIIPLVISFILPLLLSGDIARRRADLSRTKICLRFGFGGGVILTLLMLMFVDQMSGVIGGGLGAFILLVLAVPTGILAFILAAGGAALGVSMARRK